jgi:hypothetical protein
MVYETLPAVNISIHWTYLQKSDSKGVTGSCSGALVHFVSHCGIVRARD